VQNDAYVLQLSCYIHRNPLRARVVERLADYPWSSYPGLRVWPKVGRMADNRADSKAIKGVRSTVDGLGFPDGLKLAPMSPAIFELDFARFLLIYRQDPFHLHNCALCMDPGFISLS
jgi:hypothetical protein